MLLLVAASLSAHAQERTDSLPPLSGNWVSQLIAADFRINDPRIHYPKFVNFCRKIYNWGDRTFNSYDEDYVVGTGKNWKAYIKNYNWMQSYVYNFSLKDNNRVLLRTGVYSDLGVSLNFMAVSLGYTWNVNKWFHGEHDRRNTFNVSFTTALFSAEFTTVSNSTHGRVYQLGTEAEFRGLRYRVPVSQNSLNFNAYYFFNHRHYSQAAAYCFSKYQKKSAGTWLLGFDYNRQRINIDFTELPDETLAELPLLPRYAAYRYTDYNIMGGYAHNFVVGRKWLFNITVLPSIGYKKMPHREVPRREMLSLASIAKGAITYNHRALFASMMINFDGNFLLASNYSFFNSTESLTAIVGFRF